MITSVQLMRPVFIGALRTATDRVKSSDLPSGGTLTEAADGRVVVEVDGRRSELRPCLVAVVDYDQITPREGGDKEVAPALGTKAGRAKSRHGIEDARGGKGSR